MEFIFALGFIQRSKYVFFPTEHCTEVVIQVPINPLNFIYVVFFIFRVFWIIKLSFCFHWETLSQLSSLYDQSVSL